MYAGSQTQQTVLSVIWNETANTAEFHWSRMLTFGTSHCSWPVTSTSLFQHLVSCSHKSGWRVDGESTYPHSLLISQINLSSLELSLALRLTVFKLNGPRLALNHVAHCMLPKRVCISLKGSFMLLIFLKNTLHSYYRYFVSS